MLVQLLSHYVVVDSSKSFSMQFKSAAEQQGLICVDKICLDQIVEFPQSFNSQQESF